VKSGVLRKRDLHVNHCANRQRSPQSIAHNARKRKRCYAHMQARTRMANPNVKNLMLLLILFVGRPIQDPPATFSP
jgi:hypothetical protein